MANSMRTLGISPTDYELGVRTGLAGRHGAGDAVPVSSVVRSGRPTYLKHETDQSQGGSIMMAAGVATALDLRPKLLEGLATSDRNVILAAATRRRFLVKSVVVHQGDPAERLFLLTKGRARFFFITQSGKKILLHWLPPGEVFGGAAILPRPALYLVSTETLKDSSALVWDRTTIRSLATRYPKLLDNALLIASDYFAWHLASHVALSCNTARQRLAQALASLARAIGQDVPGGIELDVTNEEVGNAANVTPFTTSRLFSGWQRNGVLTKSRGKILLHSLEQLS